MLCPIQKALNDGKYSVWIDEAGIRAGQHWRNEIADGIEVSDSRRGTSQLRAKVQ